MSFGGICVHNARHILTNKLMSFFYCKGLKSLLAIIKIFASRQSSMFVEIFFLATHNLAMKIIEICIIGSWLHVEWAQEYESLRNVELSTNYMLHIIYI